MKEKFENPALLKKKKKLRVKKTRERTPAVADTQQQMIKFSSFKS